MRFLFPSLAAAHERVYRFVGGDSWDFSMQCQRHGHALCNWLSWYPTFGDGTLAHGPDQVVTDLDFADALGSLAVYLMAAYQSHDPGFPELMQAVSRCFPQPLEKPAIEFFAKVRYNAEKRVYMERNYLKVSSAEKLRYDKRWIEIPSWADGRLENIVGLVRYDPDTARSYQVLEQFSQWMDVSECPAAGASSIYYIPQQMKLVGDDDAACVRAYLIVDTFNAVRAVIKLGSAIYFAERCAKHIAKKLMPAPAAEIAEAS